MNIRRTAGALALALLATLGLAVAQQVCVVQTGPSQLSCTTSDLVSAPAGTVANVSPECSVVGAGSNLVLIGIDGSSWGINSSSVITVGGIPDTTTNAVTRIIIHNWKIYQQNTALAWYSKSTPSQGWAGTTSPLLADQQPPPSTGTGIFVKNSVTITDLQGGDTFSTGPVACTGHAGCDNINWIKNNFKANDVTIATITTGGSGSFTDKLGSPGSTYYNTVLNGAKYAITQGLTVTLKPFTMCPDGSGVLANCGFKPGDPTSFFNSLEAMLMNNAQLALDAGSGVNLLVMCTECGDYVTGPGQLGGFDTCGRWKTIMQHLHTKNSNLKLVLGPTAGSYWDFHESNEIAFTCAEFYDAGGADFIGMDPYPHYGDKDNGNNIRFGGGNAATWQAGYSNVPNRPLSAFQSQGPAGFDFNAYRAYVGGTNYNNLGFIDFMVDAINSRRQQRNPGAKNLQVIFTELGAENDDDMFYFWGGFNYGSVQQTQAANGYDGVFAAWSTDTRIYGLLQYTMVTSKPPTDHSSDWATDYGCNGKPCEAIFAKWYTFQH